MSPRTPCSMRATFLTALAAAVLVTIPRAFDEPRSAIVWLVVLGLAVVGAYVIYKAVDDDDEDMPN